MACLTCLTLTNTACVAFHGVLKVIKYMDKCGVSICFIKEPQDDDIVES
jgi:hypothetical protein